MKLVYVSFLLFIVISISGCSSKTLEPSGNAQHNIEKSQDDKKNFYSGFTEILNFDLGFITDFDFDLNFYFFKDNKVEKVQEEESLDDLLDEFSDETEIKETYDPLNGYNRLMTSFNDGMFEYFLTPVSKGYAFVIHKEIRKSIGKFFDNIFYPTRVVNNLLQGKFYNSYEETGRFVINSTIGVLGLFDPAKAYFNLEAHDEDFGQTLGFYGVGSGPHIVLPFFGPSNLRDAFAMVPDSFISPTAYNEARSYNITRSYGEYLSLTLFEEMNNNSMDVDAYCKLKEDAIDLYPYLRDVYEQYRDKQIKE